MGIKSFSIVFGWDALGMAQTVVSFHGCGTNLCLRVVLAMAAIGPPTILQKSLKI